MEVLKFFILKWFSNLREKLLRRIQINFSHKLWVSSLFAYDTWCIFRFSCLPGMFFLVILFPYSKIQFKIVHHLFVCHMSSVSFNLKQFLGFPCHDIGIFKECRKLHWGICKVLTNWNYFHYCNFISPFRLALNFHYFPVSLIVLSVIILGCCIMSFIFISLVLLNVFTVSDCFSMAKIFIRKNISVYKYSV